MRDTLTISLPGPMRRSVDRLARAEGVTASEFVRRSIKSEIFRQSLQAARRELVPLARAKGIFTDEDVFKHVS
jgi:predicted transcriptional regulator